MTDFGIQGVLDRLTQLDNDLVALYGYSERFEMVIVGGSALMLTNLAPDSRFTSDIDVLTSSAELHDLLARYDMNSDVATFLYQYPENWNLRKNSVDFDGQVLDVYTPSSEDLVITKLLAWREVDIDDINSMIKAKSFDIDALKAILANPTEVQCNIEEEDWKLLLSHVDELLGSSKS